MIVDQSPDGLAVMRGASSYIHDGNRKLQTENGADGYHVSATHWNYAAATSRGKELDKVDNVRAMSAGGWAKHWIGGPDEDAARCSRRCGAVGAFAGWHPAVPR